MESYLFFAIALKKPHYTRTELSGITQHESVTRLADLFQAEFESKWAALRKTRRASQPSLLDGACSNELNLGT